MIRTDEVELFELFQDIIVAHAPAEDAGAAAARSSYFRPPSSELNGATTRLSDLGGGAGIIAAVAARIEARGDARLAVVMRQCALALKDSRRFGEASDRRRLLGYVYPVV